VRFAKTFSRLDEMTYAQRERLAYIDFCLEYFGEVARSELMTHFGTGLASGSRDFTLYRELAPKNLILRHETKRYYRTEDFEPLFQHNGDVALAALAKGFGDGISTELQLSQSCEDAPSLIHPPSKTVATITRAIRQEAAIQVEYVSLSSGCHQRVIVPHAIINNGQRWRVRAYDRRSCSFRDFVCTRFTSLKADTSVVEAHEKQAADTDWNLFLGLELVPHPGLVNHEAVALDFKMSRDDGGPVLRLNIRAARAGYLLRYWHVDTSCNHSLSAEEHHLWLRNVEALCRDNESVAANLMIAPGFNKESEPT